MSGVTSIHLVENALLVSIQDDVTDTEIVDLQDSLSHRIAAESVRGVVLDISALEIVDTFVGRVIAQLAGISRLLDAETYVVGMRPAVAVTLVELGMYLPETRTALSLTHALSQLRRG
ncbi:STAS domain-containing protein [Pseudooceanicola sp.]|uniref:STAS domain-containing protein n=1 Tax=Pseudooceanicola sp. TaxID=1914328 RepID=UPI004059358C